MSLSTYEPVSVAEAVSVFRIDDEEEEDDDEGQLDAEDVKLSATPDHTRLEPLEIETQSDITSSRLSFEDPCWLPSICVTILLMSPMLLTSAWTFYQLIGRTWIVTPIILHWVLALLSCRLQLSSSAYGLVDIVLFLDAYNAIYKFVISQLFTDIDGTPVIEWSKDERTLQICRRVGFAIAAFRLILGTISMTTRVSRRFGLVCPRFSSFSRLTHYCRSLSLTQFHRYAHCLRQLATGLLVVAIALLIWCLVSVVVHFSHWPPPLNNDPGCDPLDTTECWLPFPSFHHMRRDLATETGWRVDLKAEILPRLKGGIKMDPHWLNEQDGFSTMGPILFYMEGLKEAFEAGLEGLKGHANIAESITQQSITLLLDVNASRLIPHTAEIDYLDVERPQVMLFPAYPLQHANHYAIAVVNATGVSGVRLAATAGMSELLKNDDAANDRFKRYKNVVMPALEVAAPWISFDEDVNTLQLLFDFVTASEHSQLGHARAVRDATLVHVGSAEWNWREHHREVLRVDNDCSEPGTLLARTIHGELDVPWFLDCFGAGCRDAFLKEDAVQTGKPAAIGKAKFILHIPCSLRAGAMGLASGKPLRSVVEYGHGLFANRAESYDSFLHQLANDEGYAIIAMDWRGMSMYDLLSVGKMLLSRPRLFQAIRDNLIQGYANKYALQHLSRHGRIWKIDMFAFEDSDGRQQSVQLAGDAAEPSFTFYGISQGGILGSGYSAMSAGLIDRAVLGVPGTPFALIMSRSYDFVGYDVLMLLDLYDNRQVRMLLALCQMGWDSVEGAGLLATPLSEPLPPVLLQAGLGDTEVPSIAAEALARGFGAVTLPNNPRTDIFGIDVDALATADSNHTPKAVLTELLYERDYLSLPVGDNLGSQNDVHVCVRLDSAMIQQVAAFLSRGEIINPCLRDGCKRDLARC